MGEAERGGGGRGGGAERGRGGGGGGGSVGLDYGPSYLGNYTCWHSILDNVGVFCAKMVVNN